MRKIRDFCSRNVSKVGHMAKRKDVSGKGSSRGEYFHGNEVSALFHNSCLLCYFPLHHVAKHAVAVIVVMPQCLMQSVPYLTRNHRGCDQLRMRMLQARTGVHAMVLEDCDVVDSAVHAEQGVAFLSSGSIAMQQEWSGPSMITS